MTLVPLAILSVLFRLSLSQSVSPMTIQNISFSDTIDLYNMYNDVFGFPGDTLAWSVYNADGPITTESLSAFNESVELMAGPAEEAGNDVVDIAATNLDLHTTLYPLPASIPLGLYHYRINSTVNLTAAFSDGFTTFTGGSDDIQNLTARSGTVNVTTSKPIGCGKNVPPPYHNITSPSSPLFTSLYVTDPSAGSNVNDTIVNWTFRDNRNSFGTGISNISVQVVDATTSDPVGSLQTPANQDDWRTGMSFQLSGVPLVIDGTYKLVVKYRNNVQDGLVAPGDVVTHTSEMFNYVTFDDEKDDCANRVGSGSNGKSQPNEGRITRLSSSCLLLSGLIIVACMLS